MTLAKNPGLTARARKEPIRALIGQANELYDLFLEIAFKLPSGTIRAKIIIMKDDGWKKGHKNAISRTRDNLKMFAFWNLNVSKSDFFTGMRHKNPSRNIRKNSCG